MQHASLTLQIVLQVSKHADTAGQLDSARQQAMQVLFLRWLSRTDVR